MTSDELRDERLEQARKHMSAANRVLPALTAREREAYIANCIADWTAGTPPAQGRKSYNRNRY
jgi:hypothetical protein